VISKIKNLEKEYRSGKTGVVRCRKCGDLFTSGGGLVIAGSGPHCYPCARIVTGDDELADYPFNEEKPEEEPD
jgi:formylmethanofuran dehydrogenase subunit E